MVIDAANQFSLAKKGHADTLRPNRVSADRHIQRRIDRDDLSSVAEPALPAQTSLVTLFPARYARVLGQHHMRTLLSGYGASLLGDGMSIVSIPVLALRTGAGPHRSLIVGASVAAANLPAGAGPIGGPPRSRLRA